ncbi:hypothetical protein BD309DRAFT_959416 [Dichomitus squalens]|nr:hypothetical protein BD309DRAFT_959416 [Dichomitus squalens]
MKTCPKPSNQEDLPPPPPGKGLTRQAPATAATSQLPRRETDIYIIECWRWSSIIVGEHAGIECFPAALTVLLPRPLRRPWPRFQLTRHKQGSVDEPRHTSAH